MGVKKIMFQSLDGYNNHHDLTDKHAFPHISEKWKFAVVTRSYFLLSSVWRHLLYPPHGLWVSILSLCIMSAQNLVHMNSSHKSCGHLGKYVS